MADKLGLGSEVRELKLGPTFTNSRNSGTAFHTLKYDFKPASVDVKKMATVDVSANNQVTVTVPHLDGAGTTHTVFKGNRKPYQKECVLIIDHSTGEITLEKLNSNLQVKKTRNEGSASRLVTPRPTTPVESSSKKSSPRQKSSPSHHSSSAAPTPPHSSSFSSSSSSSKPYCSPCVPRHSPLQASPPLPGRSPPATSRPVSSPNYSSASSHPSSLPLIGFDEGPPLGRAMDQDFGHTAEEPPQVGVLSDSSSDSSSDSASSDSESESEKKLASKPVNGHLNGRNVPVVAPPAAPLSMPDRLLNEDLQLSESGTDSD